MGISQLHIYAYTAPCCALDKRDVLGPLLHSGRPHIVEQGQYIRTAARFSGTRIALLEMGHVNKVPH